MKQLSLFLLVLIASCTPPKKVREPRLYLIHATAASFSRDLIDEKVGNLNMHHINRSVVYFTPPPEQKTGSIPLTTFLSKWENLRREKKARPPSSGYLFFEREGENFSHIPIALVLSSYDAEKDTLAVILNAVGEKFPLEKAELNEVTLFLDTGF